MTGRRTPIRVLVPYMRAYGGGVRRMLGDALPRLASTPQLEVRYAELCGNEIDLEEMEQAGVKVDRALGVPGNGVLSHHRGLRRKIDLLAAAPRLARLVWQLRCAVKSYDVFYIHGYRELLLATLALGAATKADLPALVWHCHGIGDGRVPPLLPLLARRCKFIIAVSNDVVSRLNELRIRGPHVRRIYNAVDTARIRRHIDSVFPNLPAKQEGQKALLIANASLRVDKGADLAIRALRNLPDCFVLWITGDPQDPPARGYKRELDRWIDAAGLRSRVFFIGARDDVYTVMKAADMVIVPSRVRESFGFAAAEPMALGVPVAVSNRGGLPEVVDFGRCGQIFEPDDEKTLAACVQRAFNDPARTASQINAGLKRAESVFSYARWTNEVARVLQSCWPVRLNYHSPPEARQGRPERTRERLLPCK
jgi:glycosyltransferase involved in cell wall biosynthesis